MATTDGILVIDKPSGPTSHDVVDRLRKVYGQRKIGHAGTLDPMATGVLVMLLGRATKLSQHLTGTTKRYLTTVRLGVRTTTLDAEGEVVEEKPVEVTKGDVEAAVQRLRGDIQQVPPMYSARHHKGKRLHELARKGVEVEREPRPVTIHELEIVQLDLPETLELDVRCSAGTYVRVLADDLGQALGCGANMAALRRTEAGPFTLDDAVPLAPLEEDAALAESAVLRLDDPELVDKLRQYVAAANGKS